MSAILAFLEQRLAADGWIVGQLLIRRDFTIRHVADANRSGLEKFHRAEDARELAKYDGAGRYRPLKTAPNLRSGWLLNLRDLNELRLAIDFFYPAALGSWVAFEHGRLAPIALRETLGRQTGMYRVAQRISDVHAEEVIRKTCVDGCLRRRLWTIDATAGNQDQAVERSDVLCAEACNLLVAACRGAVKENPATDQSLS